MFLWPLLFCLFSEIEVSINASFGSSDGGILLALILGGIFALVLLNQQVRRAVKTFLHRQFQRLCAILATQLKNPRCFAGKFHAKENEEIAATITTDSVNPTDLLFSSAVNSVLHSGQASVSMLHRSLGIEYSCAARLIDQMEFLGIVGPFEGSHPRKVLIDMAGWEKMQVLLEEKELNVHECGSASHNPMGEVDIMNGEEFEHFSALVLERSGFQNVHVTALSGDQGVDVLAEKEGIKYAIQCKCYSVNLGNTPVQEVCAGKSMYGCQIGAVLTNRFFTAGAKALAEKTGTLLWDRDWLIARLPIVHENSQK